MNGTFIAQLEPHKQTGKYMKRSPQIGSVNIPDMGEEYQISPHYILNRLFISQNEAFPIQSQRHLFDLTEHQGLSICLHNQLGMKLSFLYFCRSHWICIIST